jgi:Zn finger protein HypA/HybF involved in hydrogenase expression
MPRYEYRCPTCEKVLSVSRSIHDDDPGYICDNCQIPMIQIIGVTQLNFKGTGWAGTRRIN